MAGNRPVVSEYVEVSNELESTLNKVRDATDRYNEALSAKQNSDENIDGYVQDQYR
ncbi:MAG: hypothetical protein ACLUGU_04575 [Alistipes shahii]